MSTIEVSNNQPLAAEEVSVDTGVWDFLYDMPAWGISLLVHVGNNDLGALAREDLAGGFAHAVGTAGNDSNFVC